MSSEVISRLISELKPHPRNYNNHSDRQVDDLALSLKRFGQRKPIVTWRDMIVAGHGLTMAAQMAGWTSILTMPIPDDWDEATVLAYLAADNELARQADPDLAQLAAITKELEGIDEELAKLAAGGDDALKALMATIEDEKPNGDAEPQIDKAEELRVKWNVQSGQMWQLGEHRIVCGDCTDRAVVERVMSGEKADLCVTDPPYMVEYNPQWRVGLGGGGKQDFANGKVIENDNNLSWLKAFEFLPADVLYCWTADRTVKDLQLELESHKFILAYMIIWNKDLAVFGRGDYHYKYEPCLYMVRNGKNHNWQGDRKQDNVWDIPTIHSFANGHNSEEWGLVGHGNQKPLECMARPIRNNSEVGQIVYEPFSGSGTTLIACENLSRKARAVEISPAYVAVAIQRWVDVTGKEPILL